VALAAKRVIDAIAGDAAQPRPQFVVFPEMTEMLPGRDKRLLGKVLALA
jgi:predicted amidohydrolase